VLTEKEVALSRAVSGVEARSLAAAQLLPTTFRNVSLLSAVNSSLVRTIVSMSESVAHLVKEIHPSDRIRATATHLGCDAQIVVDRAEPDTRPPRAGGANTILSAGGSNPRGIRNGAGSSTTQATGVKIARQRQVGGVLVCDLIVDPEGSGGDRGIATKVRHEKGGR
jgi:hypothetical protein